MPKRMIITLPDHDITTYYLRSWGKKSADSAKGYGIAVTVLEKEKANRKTLESYLSNFTYNVVFLNGHGDQSSVTGYNNEPLIVSGQNQGKLKSTITYAISCSSAGALGDASIKAGARSYIGYADDFIFIFDDDSATHPLDDRLAALFLEHTAVLMNNLY